MLGPLKYGQIFCATIIGLILTSCSSAVETKASSDVTEFLYPIPLTDFSDAAAQLIEVSPNGIAIGEVHGQLAGIMMLDAITTAALAQGRDVLVLHEFGPTEAGLDLEKVPESDFRTVDMTAKDLPFWTENIDKRATWELYNLFEKLAETSKVELSYLWDSRLDPPPNRLKAHGFAERWKIAQTARPNSYIIALGGNYHMSSSTQYDLDVTNSLCRYADEILDTKLTCIAMDNWASPNQNCKEGQKAVVLKGKDIFQDWGYVIRRPDRCVVQAHWVKAP